MRQASDTDHAAAIVPRRFNGWGILIASVAVTAFIFLIIGPLIERSSHLEALSNISDERRLKRGLLTLCNTEANLVYLNAQLAEKSLAERNRVTRVADTLDCVKRLRPTLRAEHYLWLGQGLDVSPIVAAGSLAIEPAIEALEAEDVEVRDRAAKTLTALAERLNTDHVQRIERRLDQAPDRSASLLTLRAALGLPTLEAQDPLEATTPVPPPDAQHVNPSDDPLEVSPQHELDAQPELDAAPQADMNVDARIELDPGVEERAPQPDVDAPEAPTEERPELPRLELQEPTFELKRSPGVLYQSR